MRLKRNIQLIVCLLGISLLLVWAVFYFYTARNLSHTAEENMQRTAEQILNRLEVDFLKLEGISFSLSGKQAVLDFITEPDASAYLEKSRAVDALIADAISPADSVDHLMTCTRDGVYTRFIGTLGNTAAARLCHMLSGSTLPGYFGVTLEGVHYLCYAAEIRDGDMPVGTLALLIGAGELLELSAETSDYQVSLSSGGKIIASGDTALIGLDAPALIGRADLYQSRNVGFAPFEILVTAGEGYLSSAYTEFIVVEALIAITFILVLALFLNVSNRHLFRPMLRVIRGVEQLGQQNMPARLDRTGEETFDILVEQVNQMLDRLDGLQEIELDRQKSLIVSLKKQINAHFTVNVLNGINQLGKQGEMEKAQTMTVGLSSLLQYVNAGDEFIDMVEELQMLQKYVAMMQIRYQSEFAVQYDWDDRLMDVEILRMLVQPLAENAIEHGIDLLQSDGALYIGAAPQGDDVVFTVRDNGRGIDTAQLARLRQQLTAVQTDAWDASGISSVALVNIQRRVRSYYGEDYGLQIESRIGEGTTVTLRLPRDGKEAIAHVSSISR